MPDFDVNLGAESAKYKKNSKKINKNLNDLSLFLRTSPPRPLFWQSLGKSDFSILHDLS